MPLRYAAEPANGTDLVRAGLNRLSTRTNHLTGRGVDVNALQVTQPHAVYDLRADAVASGGGLESAVFSGFRYLVSDGDTAVAAAEVQADTAGNATLLANLNYGPFVAATAQALPKVAALAPVSSGSYEVRALRFAAIGLMALWLKPDSGGTDIIYPLAPAPPGLQADEPYTADDFFRAVRPLAQKRAAESGRTTVP
jgi:hypothetical protein